MVASEAAMISASHDDKATESCFFDPHEMAAELNVNTQPVVECFTAQSESVMPDIGRWSPLIPEAQVLGAIEVAQHSEGRGLEFGSRA